MCNCFCKVSYRCEVVSCAGLYRETLTPADADEHPLAQLVGGVGEDDGGVEVAALTKHPEEVSGVEIVEGGGDQTAPNL